MTSSEKPNKPNRLANETSPYLLQHADNPVDWYPWGADALARAAAENKPILLSVGYSACHWCHVMAHESFEDPDTAALMNRSFVNVKVDREERPDIDAIYMEAVQSMTGRGGWPMTVFLTPDGKPFYGGTYFPPTPRYGMPSFQQLLEAIAEAWQNRRPEMESAGTRLVDALNRSGALRPAATPLTPTLLERAARGVLANFDSEEGGFGGAPKFPQPMALDFLLHHYRRTDERAALNAVIYTLRKMARGGVYDQLGGGFHRYSTDDRWLAPHFEKMLYDNAQLARTYLHAWQATGNLGFRHIAAETLDYVLREMTAPAGAFYSTQDADSEDEEGKFFLWRPDELAQLLGPEDGRLFGAYYDVTEAGNFAEGGPGANILHVDHELADVAAAQGVTPERFAQMLVIGRKTLFTARENRVKPGRDDKVLAEWNGLMIHAFAEAGAALGNPAYITAAESAARFLLDNLAFTDPQGNLRLYRSFKDGQAKFNAYLEDYAAVALGLVGLYEATFDLGWLQQAEALTQTMLAHFHDEAGGGFFQTSNDHETLVARRKDLVDSAVPSGNSLASELLLRLAVLLDRPAYADHATRTMALMADGMGSQPLGFGRMLMVLDRHLHPGQEIVIVGDPAAPDTQALLAEVRTRFLPNSVLALRKPKDETAAAMIPLLASRGQIDGRATAYVCLNYACKLPVTDPAALAEQLDA